MNRPILIYAILTACIRGKVKIQAFFGHLLVNQLDIQAYPVDSSGYKIWQKTGKIRLYL
jgi:hypothetical protein